MKSFFFSLEEYSRVERGVIIISFFVFFVISRTCICWNQSKRGELPSHFVYTTGGHNLVAAAALESIAVDGAVAVDKAGNTVLEAVLGLAVDLCAGGV